MWKSMITNGIQLIGIYYTVKLIHQNRTNRLDLDLLMMDAPLPKFEDTKLVENAKAILLKSSG